MHNLICFLILVGSLFRISESAFCDYRIITTNPSDVVLTASSEFGAPIATQIHDASRGVLNYTQFTTADGKTYHGAWSAAINDQNQYIQIQLKNSYKITGVVTQGRNGCCQQWVTQYRVQYGTDCSHLKFVDSGNGTMFKGNTDEDTMVTNMIPIPITAKCVRIRPTDFHNQISMRVDIIGCKDQTTVTTTPVPNTSSSTSSHTTSPTKPTITQTFLPGSCGSNLIAGNSNVTSTVTASSTKDKGSMLVTYDPKLAYLFSKEDTNHTHQGYMGGWSPDKADTNPFIQVEFSDPTVVRGIVTQGKNGCCDKWVKRYKVFYSTDCKTWTPSGGGTGQIFTGNSDKDTPKTQILFCPEAVKCVRIQPIDWNNEIGMRFEIIGCKIIKGGIPGSNVTSSTMNGSASTTQSTTQSTTMSTTPHHAKVTHSGSSCNQSLFAHLPYQSGNIVMSASSEKLQQDPAQDYSADRGRLHSTETLGVNAQLHGGWSAANLDTNQFIQVQLPHLSTISGIVTQGKDGLGKEWVTKYRVLYSDDCKQWHVINPVGGGGFKGNSDESTEVLNMFSRQVKALCVKINPSVWNNHISLRMDLLGCFGTNNQTSPGTTVAVPSTLAFRNPTIATQSVNTNTNQQAKLCQNSLINNITLGKEVNLTATSSFHNPTVQTMPERALLDTKKDLSQLGTLLGGWSPTGSGQQYIQASFSSVQMIENVITQGMDQSQQWVTKFSIVYSEDCVNWQQLRNPKEFTANSDDHTKVNNKLGCPIFAKCIRIYPTASNNQTGLRFDLIGCNIKDSHKNSQMAVTTSPSTSSTSSTTRSMVATTLTSKSSSPTFATMSATTSVQSSMLSSTTISLQASVSTRMSTPSTSPKTSMLPSTTNLLQSSIPTLLQTHSKTITTPISSATKPMQSSVSTVLPTSSIAMTASISSSANPSTSPSTTATSTPVSTTTTKPTTHITHHVLPTGLASIYNTKDPVDCKRALLMFSCSNPIVRRHCFNSCNPKQGVSSVVSSTATSSVQFSSSSKPVVSSTASSIAPLAPSSSVMFTVSSGAQSSKTISLASSIPTQLLSSLAMVSSSGLSPTHVKTSSLPLSTNTRSSNTVMHSSQYIQPSSSHPATSVPPSSNAIMPSSLPSMTTSSAIVTTPVQHTHVVLPTGQATIYNPLDPLDCKRSLLMFSCNLSIIAKHCHHSCTKPSSSVSIISSTISLASSSSNVMSASTVKSSNGISSSVLSSNMKSSQISAATTNSVVQSSSQTLSIKASSRVQLPSSVTGSSTHITSSIAPMSSSVTSSSANVLSSIVSLQNSSPSSFVNTQTNVLLSSSSLQQPLSLSSSSMSSNMPSSSLNLQTSLQISPSSSVLSQTILSSQSQQNSASTQQYSTPLSNLNMQSSNSVLPSNTQLLSTAMSSSLQSSGSSILISSSAGSVVSISSSNIPKQNLNSASSASSSIPSSVASILSSVNGFSSMMPSSSISVGSSLLPTQNLNSAPSSVPASVASISSSASGFSPMSSSSMIAVGSTLLPTQTLISVSSVIPSTVAFIKSSRRMSFSSSVSSVSSVQSSPLSMSHSSHNSQQSTASLSSSQPVGSSFVMSSNFQTSVSSLSTSQHTASPLLTGMNLPSTSNLNSGIVSSIFSSSSSSQGFSMQSGFSSGINTSPIPTNSAIPSSGMPIPSSFMYTSHSSNGPSSQSVVSMLNSVSSNIPTPTTSSTIAHSFPTSPYLSSSPISSVKTSMASSTTYPATSSYHNSLLSMPSYYTPTPSVTNSPPLSTSLQSQQSLLSFSLPTNSLFSSNFVTSGISSSSSNLMAQSSSASIHSSMLVSSSSISTSYSQPLSLYSTGQPSLSSFSGAFNTAMPSFTPAYTSTMPMVSSALSSASVSLSVSCTLVTSMIMIPYSSSSLFTDSSLLPSVPSGISTSIFPTSIGTGYLLPSSSLPNGFSMSMIGSSQIISTSCQTVTVSPASSASNLNSNSVYSVVPSLSTSSLYSAVPVSQSVSTFVSSILPTTQVTAMHTSMIPSQSPPTTVIPPPHVAIPTGVASFYDSRDPVDCKRALQIASCTISVVSKHCPFSCASHPASPVTFSRSPPTGSSAGTKSQNVFFSSNPNSSYQNTNSTGPSTSLNLPSSTQSPSITVYPSTRKSWYDPRDPKQCEQLITWVSCSDFYYGSMCQYSCVNKRLALG